MGAYGNRKRTRIKALQEGKCIRERKMVKAGGRAGSLDEENSALVADGCSCVSSIPPEFV